MKMDVLIPEKLLFDAKKLTRAVENALDGAADAARVDFEVTTQTWVTQVSFDVTRRVMERIVSTDSRIYGYVNDGTEPHIIRPKNSRLLRFLTPYRAKTEVRVIGSGRGGRGNTTVYARMVRHPGFPGREFDDVIAKKWKNELPRIMQRAIDSEV